MNCPNCGKEVITPIKEWDLSPKVHVKLYECCGESFREYVKTEQTNLHELYKRRKNLGKRLRDLNQKIGELESGLKIKRYVSSPRLSETSEGPWIWSRKRKN